MAMPIPKMPRPTERDLAALADSLSLALPPSYTQFVANHDGAKPDANFIATRENEVAVSRFIPVREAPDLATAIAGFPVSAIPLAEDDCGNYFYVDPKTDAVHFWDHEVEGPDEEVAANALLFVEKLTSRDASPVPLELGQVRRMWVNPSFKPEF
ncbi:SMI1/KNR4 family protein [Sphingomonas sp. AR_OL41]|uniref:SMI1/KNR4 family protein n=1 Tax=Sphingomonas sp. AR_OL41 TaxID=3042729 RepID=UPI00248017AC|nr:SMI1/KNR4 family protein [Sphingomonas sp. AR_OL41]MDH7971275.1 SMI1/KNR4 family protein [Sphingomonas sp. AR_OL41]